MAKKRLNKKLLTVLLLMGVPLLLVVWYAGSARWPGIMPDFMHAMLGRDPVHLFEQGCELTKEARELDASHETEAMQISDPDERDQLRKELKEEGSDKKWEEAFKTLGRAYKYSRGDKELRKKVLAEIADLHWSRKDYGKTIAVWRKSLELDAANYEVKRKESDFFYEMARYGGSGNLWVDVAKNAEALIELRPNDAYGYMMKGHSLTALLALEASDDPTGTRTQAEEMLNKALSLDEKNVTAYQLFANLAMLDMRKSESKEERAEYLAKDEQYLRLAVEKNPEDVEAHLNLFNTYLRPWSSNLYRQAMLAEGEAERAKLQKEADAFYGKMLEDVNSCISRFKNEGRFYVVKAQIIQSRLKRLDDVDEVIKIYEQAVQCDDTQAEWPAALAQLYLIRARYSESPQVNLTAAYDLLRETLDKPNAKDMQGARRRLVSITRFGRIIPALVEVCAKLAEQEENQNQKTIYIEQARKRLKELSESLGEDDVLTKVARGTIALAEGRQEDGIKDIYDANRQMELGDTGGAMAVRLKWKLFEVLRETKYRSLAAQYAVQVLSKGIRPAQDYMSYIDVISEFPGQQNKLNLLELIKSYESKYSPDVPFQEKVLKIKAQALLVLGRYEEAQEAISGLGDDGRAIKLLRGRSHKDAADRIKALVKLAKEIPGDEEVVILLYRAMMSQVREGVPSYDQLRQIVSAAVQAEPENIRFQQIQKILQEPDAANVPSERLSEIALETIKNTKDPFNRAVRLGSYYAARARENVLGQDQETAQRNWELAKEQFSTARGIKKDDLEALSSEFRAVVGLKDWAGAEDLLAKINKIDSVQGLYYESHLKQSQQQWNDAANLLESYLERRPISVEGHLSLSRVYGQLRRGKESLEQVRMAVSQDFSNVAANNTLMLMMHNMHSQGGLSRLPSEQIKSMLVLIKRVLNLEPSNLTANQLLVTYESFWIVQLADQVNSPGMAESVKKAHIGALAQIYNEVVQTCKYLISRDPGNVQNIVVLAKVHYLYARAATDDQQRNQLWAEAEKIFKQAIEKNPDSVELVAEYGDFLRSTGKKRQDEKLLQDMIKQNSGEVKYQAMVKLGDLYARQGQLQKAAEVLEKILEEFKDKQQSKIMLAELFSRMKEYGKALDMFRQLREKEDSEYLLTRHIETLLDMGQEEQSQALLDSQMKQEYPDSVATMLLSAKVSLRRTKYVEAVAYADQALAKSSQNRLALLIKSQALYYNEQFQEAMDSLVKLRTLESSGSNLGRMLLTQVNWSLGFHDDAIDELQATVEQNPGYTEAREMLVRMLKKRGRLADLERLYANIIKVYPNDAKLYVEAAQASMQSGDKYLLKKQRDRATRQYEKGLALMQSAWKVSRETGEEQRAALDGLLRALLKTGQYQQVATLATQNLKKGYEDAALLLYQAEATYRLNRPQEALNLFESILNMVSDRPSLSDQVVMRARRIGDVDKMSEWCKNKLRAKPDWTAMHLVLAGIYRGKGRVDQEISELKAARSSANENLSENIDRQLMVTYLGAQRWQEAVDACRQLMKKRPNDAALMNNLAYALLETGSHDEEAVATAKKAYDLNRTNTNVMDTYAMALTKMKDYGQAELIMLRAIQEKRRSENHVPPEYEYHLVQALQGQKQYGKALERLRKVQKQLQESVSQRDSAWLERINTLLTEIEQQREDEK
ncbi:MAG: tetratricopeptide repeat protein [Sedimentisphaerales bacterium]|nr:tetratricopeptide repeat protein [Sedimentisphaerales bacterium]